MLGKLAAIIIASGILCSSAFAANTINGTLEDEFTCTAHIRPMSQLCVASCLRTRRTPRTYTFRFSEKVRGSTSEVQPRI
jgi:hypothetical protein